MFLFQFLGCQGRPRFPQFPFRCGSCQSQAIPVERYAGVINLDLELVRTPDQKKRVSLEQSGKLVDGPDRGSAYLVVPLTTSPELSGCSGHQSNRLLGFRVGNRLLLAYIQGIYRGYDMLPLRNRLRRQLEIAALYSSQDTRWTKEQQQQQQAVLCRMIALRVQK